MKNINKFLATALASMSLLTFSACKQINSTTEATKPSLNPTFSSTPEVSTSVVDPNKTLDKVQQVNFDAVAEQITWSAVENADKYKIKFYSKKGGEFVYEVESQPELKVNIADIKNSLNDKELEAFCNIINSNNFSISVNATNKQAENLPEQYGDPAEIPSVKLMTAKQKFAYKMENNQFSEIEKKCFAIMQQAGTDPSTLIDGYQLFHYGYNVDVHGTPGGLCDSEGRFTLYYKNGNNVRKIRIKVIPDLFIALKKEPYPVIDGIDKKRVKLRVECIDGKLLAENDKEFEQIIRDAFKDRFFFEEKENEWQYCDGKFLSSMIIFSTKKAAQETQSDFETIECLGIAELDIDGKKEIREVEYQWSIHYMTSSGYKGASDDLDAIKKFAKEDPVDFPNTLNASYVKPIDHPYFVDVLVECQQRLGYNDVADRIKEQYENLNQQEIVPSSISAGEAQMPIKTKEEEFEM